MLKPPSTGRTVPVDDLCVLIFGKRREHIGVDGARSDDVDGHVA